MSRHSYYCRAVPNLPRVRDACLLALIAVLPLEAAGAVVRAGPVDLTVVELVLLGALAAAARVAC